MMIVSVETGANEDEDTTTIDDDDNVTVIRGVTDELCEGPHGTPPEQTNPDDVDADADVKLGPIGELKEELNKKPLE